MSDIPVIAVDGPSGTGKGTICANLAAWLGWHLLDSGALYRVLALAVLDEQRDSDNEAEVAILARGLDVTFRQHADNSGISVLLNGIDVSARIRTEECGNAASKIAAYPSVRAALVDRQRAFRQAPGLIADGRDMGTVIFTDAALKIFLTASPEERAERRYKQLIGQGIGVNLARLSAEITERDERDRKRAASPLIPAPDAIVIDTTALGIDAVTKKVTELVRERFTDL